MKLIAAVARKRKNGAREKTSRRRSGK